MQFLKKSLNERIRTSISRFIGIGILILCCISTSCWETENSVIEEGLMLWACLLAGIGAFGRVWCALYISGYKNNQLVVKGPYSLCRNPLYFFSLLGSIGVGFATETFTITFLIIIMFVLYYPTIILREEKRLIELFGDSYKQYINDVPAFIPNFSKFREPDTYSVNPRLFRKSIIDALWFIWLIGIVEFIGGLREYGILPTYISLF